jgi:hypothetical protein
MSEWFSAAELSEIVKKIPPEFLPPRFPKTKVNLIQKAKREGWQSKPRTGPGGGCLYHIDNLPTKARNHLSVELYKAKVTGPAPLIEPAVETPINEDLTPRDMLRRDAKMVILCFFDEFKARTGLPVKGAQFKFAELYNARDLPAIPAWVYDSKKTISGPSLERWRAKRAKGQMHEFAGNYGHRRGSGLLDRAEGGKVAEYIAALIVNQPHLSADHVRDLVKNKFGDRLTVYSDTTKETKVRDVPPIRTFQRFISAWKEEHEEVLVKMTDPDAWKNKYKFRGENMNHWVTKLNQLWEIDASPADAMLVDGRYSIYAVIDIYSRRMMVLVSKTPTTAAVLLLLRKAILAWGVPDILRTDNGSDFTSYEFITALNSLQITPDLCEPFSPEMKASVERTIGTLQRGFMPLLPGFIGHDVADRKKIEARKTFAQRLGEKDQDIFCADLTHEEFQSMVDDWCANKYAHKEHSGINKETPFQRAANWTAPIKRIENERALDLLLAPIGGKDGYRTVTAKGIRLDGGQRVFIRHDPEDMGRIYVFGEERQEFICVAECPKRVGVNPGDAVRAVRAEQKRRLDEEIKPLKRQIKNMKPRDMIEGVLRQAAKNAQNVTEFPKASTEHTTPDLKAAAEATRINRKPAARELNDQELQHQKAIERDLAAKTVETVVSMPESPKQRFKRAWEIEQMMEQGRDIAAEDAKWLVGYATTSEYRSHKKMFEDFGLNWLQG